MSLATPPVSRRMISALFCAAFLATARVACAADAPPVSVAASPMPVPSPALGAAAAADASNDPCTAMSSIVSRPSVSTSPCSVKTGNLLLETGYSNTSVGGPGGASTILYPQASVRSGLFGKLEFDINPSSIETISSSPVVRGTTDSGIGLHYEFGYTDRLILGTNAVYAISNRSPEISANSEGASLNLEGSYTLSPALGLFSTVGYEAEGAGTPSASRSYRAVLPSLGMTLTLPAGFDAFVEGFGQSSTGPGQSGRYAYDVAVQKGIGTRLQLDANLFEYPATGSAPHQVSTGFGAAYLIGPSK